VEGGGDDDIGGGGMGMGLGRGDGVEGGGDDGIGGGGMGMGLGDGVEGGGDDDIGGRRGEGEWGWGGECKVRGKGLRSVLKSRENFPASFLFRNTSRKTLLSSVQKKVTLILPFSLSTPLPSSLPFFPSLAERCPFWNISLSHWPR